MEQPTVRKRRIQKIRRNIIRTIRCRELLPFTLEKALLTPLSVNYFCKMQYGEPGRISCLKKSLSCQEGYQIEANYT